MTQPKQCRSGKTRYRTSSDAYRALQYIQNKPMDPSRSFDFYRPNGVRSCGRCNGFHLTSNSGKQYRSGKSGRNRRVYTYRARG